MKKTFILSSLLLGATILTSCSGNSVKIDYMSKKDMLSTYTNIYEASQKDIKQNDKFEYIECVSKEIRHEKDGKSEENTNIVINYNDKHYYCVTSIYNHKTKETFKKLIYAYIEGDTFYYYQNIGGKTNPKYYFTSQKDEAFKKEAFGDEIEFTPYNDFLDTLDEYASKEDQVRNIKNLNNTLQNDSYITEYNIQGYNPDENTFRLDYSYPKKQEGAQEYNLSVEHYVSFKNNYVSEYYFKQYNGDESLEKFIINPEERRKIVINKDEYELMDPTILFLPRIHIMIGY